MEIDPKEVKKIKRNYEKKYLKIISNCKRNKYKQIPISDLEELLSFSKQLNDKEGIFDLYNNYKRFIPTTLLKEIESYLLIKKEIKEVKKTFSNEVKKEEVKYKTAIQFNFKSYDELGESTKELLNHYNDEGYLFKVAKKYKTFNNDEEEKIIEQMDKNINNAVKVYWSNDEELKIIIYGNEEKLTVLDAIEKYKDNVYFMIHLNFLLGLSIYTSYDAYIREKPIVRVLK